MPDLSGLWGIVNLIFGVCGRESDVFSYTRVYHSKYYNYGVYVKLC